LLRAMSAARGGGRCGSGTDEGWVGNDRQVSTSSAPQSGTGTVPTRERRHAQRWAGSPSLARGAVSGSATRLRHRFRFRAAGRNEENLMPRSWCEKPLQDEALAETIGAAVSLHKLSCRAGSALAVSLRDYVVRAGKPLHHGDFRDYSRRFHGADCWRSSTGRASVL
jgi:hypothetical protein